MPATNPPALTIIVPMKDEEAVVQTTTERLARAAEGVVGPSWEILLIDDGSTDRTYELGSAIAAREPRVRILKHAKNYGRGRALRTGFAAARGDVVMSVDADLTYDESHVPLLYNALVNDPDADVVLGSAYMPGGKVEGVSARRLIPSKIGNLILRFALEGRVYTSTCVLRAYRRKVLEAIDLESDGKDIHLEILERVWAAGYRVKEIPATLRGRQKGQGKSKSTFLPTVQSHLIFSFISRPMVAFGAGGLLMLVLGVLTGGYITVLWFQSRLTPDRPLMVLTVLMVLGGTQLLSFGFIALQIAELRRDIARVQRDVRLEAAGEGSRRADAA
ncbi:MAG TPA: glycosyltransferase family 2 protein [bacterium]|nr:glycosyltransferase family 2 protein [bacterium]